MTAEQIIAALDMKPLPVEGGYFTVTHIADEHFRLDALPKRYSSTRPIYGAIYYLVTSSEFSALHKLPTDELYYYHLGDPLEMLLLGPKGKGKRQVLGIDLNKGQRPQLLVPKSWWQGSRPLPAQHHGYSLVSTSMAPGYHETDPVFGDREALKSAYPDFRNLIDHLTRV